MKFHLKMMLVPIAFILLAMYLAGCSAPIAALPISNVETVQEAETVPIDSKDDVLVTVPIETPVAPETEPTTPPDTELKAPPGGILTVEFIDVGQGDSTLIVTPEGRSILIDAGTSSSYDTIASALNRYNIGNIDLLIATHPHADHIGAMSAIVSEYGIGKIYMPDATTNTKTFETLLNTIKGKGLKISLAQAGKTVDLEKDIKLVFISPQGAESDLNNASAVLKLTYGNVSFLFAGDMESSTEAKIVANIEADVLKIGHHGSDTSTSNAFLDKVSPQIAVISVGTGNTYGHPADTTLSKLKSKGVQVYRTDESGTITMTTSGEGINVNKTPSTIAVATPNKEPATFVAPAPTPVTQEEEKGTAVYRTNTGTKYHLDGCSSLSKSKIEMTLEEAKKMGLEPCKVCDPPN